MRGNLDFGEGRAIGTMTPSILHWNSHFYPIVGGISSHLAAICTSLTAYRHTIVTNALKGSPPRESFGRHAEIIRLGPRDWIHSPPPRLGHKVVIPAAALADVLRASRARRLFRENDGAVFHVHDVDWSLARLDSLIGTTVGARIARHLYRPVEHSPSLLTKHFLFPRDSPTPLRRLERRLTLRFSTIVCVDRAIEETVREWAKVGGIERDVRFIPNSVDPELFRPRPFPPLDRLRVGFLARLDAAHGEEFLRQFLLNLPDFVEFYGAIAADAERFDRIVGTIRSARIHIRRNVPPEEVPDFLAGIHVLLNPLTVDYAITVSALEAMASGRCVLMFGEEERPPLVPDKTAFFTAPILRDVLARLGEVYRDPDVLYEIGRNARDAIVADFTHDRVLPRLGRLYADLLAARS